MEFEEAVSSCPVRGAIYQSLNSKYWKNHPIRLKERVTEKEQTLSNWEVYDPRDDDDCSLFMFND